MAPYLLIGMMAIAPAIAQQAEPDVTLKPSEMDQVFEIITLQQKLLSDQDELNAKNMRYRATLQKWRAQMTKSSDAMPPPPLLTNPPAKPTPTPTTTPAPK